MNQEMVCRVIWRPVLVSALLAAAAVGSLVGAYRSHLEGRPVALPLEDPSNPWV